MHKIIAARFLFLILIFSASALFTPHQISAQESQGVFSDEDKDELRDYILSGMEQWEIPGLTLAIVRNGQVFTEGFGVKKLGESDPVDEHTLFGIASTTKAMTAFAAGILVDEGKLSWDDPIVKHLPDFKLYDPYVTANITLRDALTHRSGLGRMTGNRIQYMPFRDRTELLYRMRYMEPEAPFRSRYVYSNMMYMVAGEVIRSVSGKSWDDFMTERFFAPLGMDQSNTSITAFSETENAAWPHQEIRGEVVPIPRRNFDNVGASASVNSSAGDISKWLQYQLGPECSEEGAVLREALPVSQSVLAELYSPVTAMPSSNRLNPVSAYALGWSVSSYEGRTVYRHGGATDGMNTSLIVVPGECLALFISTNVFNRFMHALGNHIMDMHLGNTGTDWNNLHLRNYLSQKERTQQRRDEINRSRQLDTEPSHHLEKYAGNYHDNLYDNVEVKLGNDGLELHFWGDETQIADLEHWHYDTFRAHWRNPAQREKFVYFTMGKDGTPEELRVKFTLRPALLQVGIYPTDYYRWVKFQKVD